MADTAGAQAYIATLKNAVQMKFADEHWTWLLAGQPGCQSCLPQSMDEPTACTIRLALNALYNKS